ncbi:EamA family transporter [Allonocardiopsis opalescens]|uniref:EamA family transporter n=1 Tax=Allonocardiopsis opalescens TaxID=1144618 RepID=UPI001FE6127E|nr:EamA family transporter [Allonocardiopsis opalescens]
MPTDRVTATRSGAPPRSAAWLVLGSVLSVQLGQSFGKLLFGEVGPMGVAALRLGLAALVLCALYRPRPPRTARAAGLAVGFGTAIAGMNLVYPALVFLPVGVAVTLQLLGPLTVALLGSRRRADLGWAALAALGLALFAVPWGGGGSELPPAGVALALASGAAMGAYLLFSRRAGARAADGSVLALAVVWAALLTLPFGIADGGAALLRPGVLAAGLGVAVLSAVLPYALDLAALRRLPPRVVGVLESLEPAVGACAALVVLGEFLTLRQWLAVGCVVAASSGAVAWTGRRGR